MSDKLEAEIERLRHKLWMIACHATGGGIPEIEGIDRSTNDICVQISAHVNRVYEGGKEASLRTPAPEQAGEVERARIMDIIRNTHSTRTNYNKRTNRATTTHQGLTEAADAILAALQSTPPAHSTEVQSGATAFHESPVSSKVAQPTADAVERGAEKAAYDAGLKTLAYYLESEHGFSTEYMAMGVVQDALRAYTATTMSGDYVMVPREGCTCARRHDPDQFDHEQTCALIAASAKGGECKSAILSLKEGKG